MRLTDIDIAIHASQNWAASESEHAQPSYRQNVADRAISMTCSRVYPMNKKYGSPMEPVTAVHK